MVYENLKRWVEYPSIREVILYKASSIGSYDLVSMESVYKGVIAPLMHFCKFHGYSDPETLLNDIKSGKIKVEDYIISWRNRLLMEGLAPQTIITFNKGLKLWLKVNDVEVDWDRIERKVRTPRRRNIVEDRAPTVEELRVILSRANPKMAAIILLAATSGLRLGTIANLKIKDIDLTSYPDIGIVKVRPELSKNRYGYYALFSSEAKEAIQSYLEYRREKAIRKKGELLSKLDGATEEEKEKIREEIRLLDREIHLDPELYLFPGSRPDKPIQPRVIEKNWINLLKKSGLAVKCERGKKKFYTLHFHTLRKFFRTQLEGWLTKSEIMRLMGHTGSGVDAYLDGAYFKPPEKHLITKYRLAQHRLTILKTSKQTQHDKMDMLRSLIKMFAPIIGLDENTLNRIEVKLTRSRSIDEAIREIHSLLKMKKFGENRFETNGGERRIKIVRTEDELIYYLERGWRILKELRDGRIILER